MPSGFRKYLQRQGGKTGGRDPRGASPESPPPAVLEADAQGPSGLPRQAPATVISGESVRNLAHELRSPLTAIKSSLQLVTAGEAGPLTADQEHFLTLALRNLDRLDRMTTDLLDRERAKDHSARCAPTAAVVDLGRVLGDGVRLHAVAAGKSGLDFDSTGLPESFAAEVDADRIMQVVDNLLSNALKFTSPPGLVRIWLDQHPPAPVGLAGELARAHELPLDLFTLVIEDSGRGIPPERQARLFEVFSRVHDEERLDIPGSGLGLHITRDVVGAMGGRLSLASRQGRGTTIWVRLPRNEKTRRLLLSVADFQARFAAWNQGPRPVEVLALDLRRQDQAPDEQTMGRFLAQMEDKGVGLGARIVSGLWAAGVSEREAWLRAWPRFLFRAGAPAPAANWRRLGTRRMLAAPEVARLV